VREAVINARQQFEFAMYSKFITFVDRFFNDVVSRLFIIDDIVDNM
jgi:hypothetical protein